MNKPPNKSTSSPTLLSSAWGRVARLAGRPPTRIKTRFARRLKRISELKVLGLEEAQVFPPKALLEAKHVLPPYLPLIDRTTPVGSMGSCFAREIRNYLIREEFNYVQRGEGKDAEHGSARWNRVYNTPCILQEIERAFDRFEPDLVDSPSGTVIDPHRKQAIYSNATEADRELKLYRSQAKSAFLDSKVFVFTLGLSEVWHNKLTGSAYAEAPDPKSYHPERDGFRVVSPDENVEKLRRAFGLLKEMNPDIEIIVTVSPVPLRATFVPRSALVSNSVSKATLIWAAHAITQELSYVHYFPSYEIVQYYVDDPFEWDFRHVKPGTVNTIMSMFQQTFMRV